MKLSMSCWLAALLLSVPASASWWIEPDDLALRHDIELLADAGVIQQPVNTYPLMWSGIVSDLQNADHLKLPRYLQAVHQRVLDKYQEANKSRQVRLSAAGETEQPAVVRFGDTLRDKAQLQAQAEMVESQWSGRLTVSQVSAPVDGQHSRLDGSYLAARVGNWIVSAGALEKYWGPSFDSSSIMSTNARPIPAVTLSRDSSSAAADDWLPAWTFTTSFGEQSSRAQVPDAKLWQARLGVRPWSSLELGFSWVMQYGGRGYGNSFSDWFDGLSKGGDVGGTENMLAGYDLRWHGTIWSQPIGLYMSANGDDFNKGSLRVMKVAYQAGIDTYISAIESKVYLDWLNTTVDCTDDTRANCLYEHATYTDGYRQYGRAIGATYDNDSFALNLGILTRLDSNTMWHNKLAWLRLNLDGTRVSYPSHWTQNQLPARTVLLWRTEQQWQEQQDQWKWGLEFSNTRQDASGERDWQTELFVKWQRNF